RRRPVLPGDQPHRADRGLGSDPPRAVPRRRDGAVAACARLDARARRPRRPEAARGPHAHARGDGGADTGTDTDADAEAAADAETNAHADAEAETEAEAEAEAEAGAGADADAETLRLDHLGETP